MELVSVIMPAFNAGATIKQAIESVIAQTYPHWELWVLNDGSTDETRDLVQSIDDSRVQVKTSAHQGVSEARNLGLKLAEGQWIAFLDADDWWLPEKLERQISRADGQKVLVHGDYLTLSGGKMTQPNRLGHCPGFAQEGNLFGTLIQHDYIGTLSVMIPQAAVQQVGGFDPLLHAPADWDYWIRLSEIYPWVYVDEPVAVYRDHKGGISKEFEPFARDLEVILNRYLYPRGTTDQKTFGAWINYRHMGHQAARSGHRLRSLEYWKKAFSARPWVASNLSSLLYCLLRPSFLR